MWPVESWRILDRQVPEAEGCLRSWCASQAAQIVSTAIPRLVTRDAYAASVTGGPVDPSAISSPSSVTTRRNHCSPDSSWAGILEMPRLPCSTATIKCRRGVIELGEARARSRQSDQERRGCRAELGDMRAQVARPCLLAQVIGERRERPAQRERCRARVR